MKAVLPLLRASIPPSINLTAGQDRTVTIRASVHDVEVSLVISIVLVVLVIFAFLHSVWATAIPGVAVPVSLVGTFGVMYLLGYSIDNLSLMALTISTGFVVDDAIVVIENITRYLEKGMAPLEAALEGSTRDWLHGALHEHFAHRRLHSHSSDGRNSRPHLPRICHHAQRGRGHLAGGLSHRHAHDVRPAAQAAREEQAEKGLFRDPAARIRFAWPTNTPAACAGPCASSRSCLHCPAGHAWPGGLSVLIIPKGFFPQQDTGRISGLALSSEDTSFQTMRQKLGSVHDSIIQSDPAVGVVTGNIGARSNQASFNVTLKPLAERKVSADQVINRLRPRLARVPGATLFLQAVQDVPDRRPPGQRPISVHLAGRQFQGTARVGARELLQSMKAIPGLLDVNTDLQNHGLEAGLVIDRDTASRLGITAADHRQYALRRFWPAAGLHHVQSHEPVLCGDGDRSAVPDRAPMALKNIYLRSTTGTDGPA